MSAQVTTEQRAKLQRLAAAADRTLSEEVRRATTVRLDRADRGQAA